MPNSSLTRSTPLPRHWQTPSIPMDRVNNRHNRLAHWLYHSGTEPLAMYYDADMTHPARQFFMVPAKKWPSFWHSLMAWRTYWVPWFNTLKFGFVQKKLRRIDHIGADTL